MSNNVIKQWNDAALAYAHSQEASGLTKVNKEIVYKRFKNIGKKTVLDLGCGYGNYTDFFWKEGADVIGCDGSAKMLHIAQEKYPHCKFELVDIEKSLPYKEGQFDIVFCNQVLMDIEKLEEILTEISRIIKRNGIFYMSIVHPAFYDGDWLRDEAGYCRAKLIQKYLSEYSFDNEFWGTTSHFHRPVSRYINAALQSEFALTELLEPESYDGVEKNKEIPLFLFAEFRRI